jgi:hypothetical protein
LGFGVGVGAGVEGFGVVSGFFLRPKILSKNPRFSSSGFTGSGVATRTRPRKGGFCACGAAGAGAGTGVACGALRPRGGFTFG